MATVKTEHNYVMLTGEALAYERPSPRAAEYLQHLVKAAHDPSIGESEFLALLFNADNPVMDGMAGVALAAFSDPIFQIMIDLLCRKRSQAAQRRDADRNYTMTVQEAAALRQVHESAIRQAIQAQRLVAVKRGKAWLLDPRDVTALELNPRKAPNATVGGAAPLPAIEAHVGGIPDGSFRLRAPEFVQQAGGGGKVLGFVPQFRQAAVIFGPKGSYRMFVLEHAPGERGEVRFGPFYARGDFRVIEKINNSQVASTRWREFEAR
jgi:excisionase family DNA binding protein